MNRRLFSRPRCNPRWLVNLARSIGAVRRFLSAYRFYRARLNQTPAAAWAKARLPHL